MAGFGRQEIRIIAITGASDGAGGFDAVAAAPLAWFADVEERNITKLFENGQTLNHKEYNIRIRRAPEVESLNQGWRITLAGGENLNILGIDRTMNDKYINIRASSAGDG